jgi:ribosomal protein L7/L12
MEYLIIGGLLLALIVVLWLTWRWSRNRGVVTVQPAISAPPATGEELIADVRTLLAAGRKIEAVRQVRLATGWGLKQSKEYVEAVGAGAPLPDTPLQSSPPAAHDPAQLEQEARSLLAEEGKISAIKHVREHTNWGLQEAKDYVERLS